MALFLAIKLPAIITSSHCLLQSCCTTTQCPTCSLECKLSFFFFTGSLSPLVSCGSVLGFDITCRAPSAASLLTQCLVSGTRKAQIRGNSAKAGPPVKSPTTPTASEAGASAAASLHRTAAADHYPSASSTSSSAPRVTLPESLSIAKSIDVVVPTPLDIPQPLPLWLNTACAKHIVKGNFMTLSARPKTVDHGEWVAHQGK